MTHSVLPRVLSINGGSFRIKFAPFAADKSLQRILSGSIDRIGMLSSTFAVKDLNPANGFSRPAVIPDHTVAARHTWPQY